MIIPFYTSSGGGKKYGPDGKTLHGVGKFFPFWGVSPDTHWFNKTRATWEINQENMDIARTNEDRTKYYGSKKLAKIGRELDELFPGYDEMNEHYNADRDESSRSQYGLDNYQKQLNQGFVKNGIEPADGSGDKLYANIKASKKIIGLEDDGPITYKLVPFNYNRRFTRRGNHYFVLVDINPAPKKPSNDPQPVRPRNTPTQSDTTVEEEEEEFVDPWTLARDRYPIQRRQQNQYVMVGRNPGGDNDE